jgi:hypothetical protein
MDIIRGKHNNANSFCNKNLDKNHTKIGIQGWRGLSFPKVEEAFRGFCSKEQPQDASATFNPWIAARATIWRLVSRSRERTAQDWHSTTLRVPERRVSLCWLGLPGSGCLLRRF